MSGVLELKPGEWLGLELAFTNERARAYGARRLGCDLEQIEIRRTGGAVLVRIREEEA